MNKPGTTRMNSRLEWVSALMPIVVHELNNATQYLGMLHSLHNQDLTAGILERSSDDLVRTASTVEELGLMMAILSTAAGTDLLLDRRSDQGLSIAVDLTVKAIRKRGHDVVLPEGFEVACTGLSAQGWELPWSVGASLLIASDVLPEGESLAVQFKESGWGAQTGGGEAMRSHATLVGTILPATTAEVSDSGWSFGIPAGWVSVSGPVED